MKRKRTPKGGATVRSKRPMVWRRLRGWWMVVSLVVLGGCAQPRARSSVTARPPSTWRPARPSEVGDEITPPAPVLAVGPDPSDCPRGDENISMVFSSEGYGCPFPREGARRPRTVPPPRPEDLPSRPDIAAALRAVGPAIRACGDGSEWRQVEVTVHFASDGSVARVRVWRGFESLPLGQCVAAAARAARLPPFGVSEFGVTFPFALGR